MNNTLHHPFKDLRECQFRAASEQQILSGRDWLLVTALVQFLTALYPLYQCFSYMMLPYDDADKQPSVEWMAIGMVSVCVILLLLWWRAKYAPFRAAMTALVFYILLQLFVAWLAPMNMFDGIASKVLVLLGLIMAVRTGYRRRHSA